MKSQILPVAIALMMVGQGAASAQSAYAVIDLPPNQRAYIKDYVLRERVRPAILEERVALGGTVNSNIELRQVPADWGPCRYRGCRTLFPTTACTWLILEAVVWCSISCRISSSNAGRADPECACCW